MSLLDSCRKWWDRFRKGNEGAGLDDHLVRLHIPLFGGPFGQTDEIDQWSALEDALGEAVTKAKAGTLDGHEIGGGEYTIWLYGPEGARLAKVVKATLLCHHLPPNSFLFIRHGGLEDAAAPEETVPLT